MQIRELVLYGYNQKVRHLSFKLGRVNIITGKSKSGKSTVGDIIEYCLGGDSCNIPDGIVRENVAWYGLLLQFSQERVFVARKNPDNGQQTTTACYIEVGTDLEVPEQCNFTSNINVSGIEEALTRRIGISENLNKPPEGQSRYPLEANIRHSLFYCFQGQDEIAAKNFVFHRQSEDFITQSIKDSIPYFLGAVSEEALALDNERSILKRKLRLEKKKIEENNSLKGLGSQKAVELVSEAIAAGLINPTMKIDYQNEQELYTVLQNTLNWVPNQLQQSVGVERLISLQNRLQEYKDIRDNLDIDIDNTKGFFVESAKYSTEAEHQKTRLESIMLFDHLDFNPGRCPFCSGELKQPLPGVAMIKASIKNLDKSISNVTREQPKLNSYISELKQKREKITEEIKLVQAEIDGFYNQEEEYKQLKDQNAMCGRVIGRISMWLESVDNYIESGNQEKIIKDIENRIKEIDDLLDYDTVDERKQFALSRIQENMTKWAKELKLEHSDSPYRLDLNKVTVVVDKPDRPVPLKQMGSGSNWVGVHLITYFALQNYFIGQKRPVPNFLFLDQPSQVYFPSETDEKKTDLKAVAKMYQFIVDRTIELQGNFQIIIVDHANLEDASFSNAFFKEYICEDWWPSDENLVPNGLYEIH